MKKSGLFCLLTAVFMLFFAACDVPGGNVNVNLNQTPAAEDFIFGNLAQTAGNVTPVTVTPQEGKSGGAITVYYEGIDPEAYPKSTDLPTAIGEYAVTFDVAAAAGWNAAEGLSAGTLTIANQTPSAGDYDIDNLTQTLNSPPIVAVTVTPKEGKSGGNVTVYYNGSTALPTTAGTYPVTFNVAAAAGWNAAEGLAAGTLTISPANQTPVAGDYNFGNLTQTLNSPPIVAVTITPKEGKSGGNVTVYYNGSATLPTTAGTYPVTFNVAAATGWNAANGLSAGNLVIEGSSIPVSADVQADKAALEIETYMDYFYYEILLPGAGASGNTSIQWASSDARYPVKTDKTPHRIRITDTTDFIGTLTLTATIKASNGYSETKGFNVRVRDYEFYGYLCAYFTGNSVAEQQVRFALGTDGRNFTAINSNAPVIPSSSIAETGCIRDPFVRRGADGQFYMSLTDMDASTSQWDSNRGIILLKSSDLINWSHSRIKVSTRWPATFGDIKSAWAPEVVYDRSADKYMVTWSSFRSAALEDHIIYWAYANSNFTDLEGSPVQLIDHSTLPRSNGSNRTTEGNTIDGNIAWVNGTYYLFYKNERANAPAVPNNRRIARASSPALTGPYSSSTASDNIFSADNQNQEGCQSYRLFGTDNYVVVYDRYNQSTPTWGYWVSNNGFTSWQTSNQSLTVNGFFPRHGHIMPITRAEYDRLNAEWGPPTNPTVTTDATLRVHYTFDGTDTATAIANKATGYTGSAYTATGAGGGYSLANTNGMPNFYTGTNTSNTTGNNSTGYISIPSSTTTRNLINQGNYTIAAYVRIETTAAPTGNGWFLWCFTNNAASDATTGQYMFTRAREMRQTYSLSGYGAESSVSHTSFSLTRNTWYHVMYRQVGNIGTIYVNGAPVAVGRHTIANTSLANATAGIWFGRPCFANDNYMQRTRYGDVRIYSGAISESQIAALGIPARVAQLNQ